MNCSLCLSGGCSAGSVRPAVGRGDPVLAAQQQTKGERVLTQIVTATLTVLGMESVSRVLSSASVSGFSLATESSLLNTDLWAGLCSTGLPWPLLTVGR